MSDVLREVVILGADDIAMWAARLIEAAIDTSVKARGVCRLVLAGGRTPAQVYCALAQLSIIPWTDVQVYIGDERCVPPTHADSNYRMIAETLLSAVAIPAAHIHRLRGEIGSTAAAAEYQTLLDPLPEPKFDFVLNGVGADGHTASLFPGDARVSTAREWALPAVSPPQFAVTERVGLSMRALCSTRVACVICTGAEKRAVRGAILTGDPVAQTLPAARLRGTERTIWIVDAE